MKNDITYIRQLIDTHLQSQSFGPAGEELFALLQDKTSEETILRVLEEYTEDPNEKYDKSRWDEVFKKIENQIDKTQPISTRSNHSNTSKTRKLKIRTGIAIAATLFAISVVGIIIYNNNSTKAQDLTQAIAKANIKPGKNTATLTLANGKKIVLDEHGIGELAKEAGVSITKTATGELIYTITDTKQTDNTKINTLTTANGETAKVILPDGTKVWLNAASSISYPSSFAAAPRREVRLSGEAYFEAAHDNKHPFVVSSANQTVTVLGTQFDISAYHDDNTTKTTLLEGTVQVKTSLSQNSKTSRNAATLNTNPENSLTLNPGQQSSLTPAGILSAKEVKPELFIDWKEGYFAFDKEPLGSIMKRVGRWYDVEFIFDDPTIKEERFYGTLSRFDNLNKMLNAISKGSEVNFKIEGKVIRISR